MREGEGALEGGEDEVAFDGLWLVLSLGLSPFHRDSVRLRPLLLLPFWGDVLLALGERGLGEVLLEVNEGGDLFFSNSPTSFLSLFDLGRFVLV